MYPYGIVLYQRPKHNESHLLKLQHGHKYIMSENGIYWASILKQVTWGLAGYKIFEHSVWKHNLVDVHRALLQEKLVCSMFYKAISLSKQEQRKNRWWENLYLSCTFNKYF